jgi:transposase InsO family protein
MRPTYCPAQDTSDVDWLNGVGRVYRQTVIDTYSKIGSAKRYTGETPLAAADILHDWVSPFLDEHDMRVDRTLTDRGTECCGVHESQEYELHLAVANIDRTRTKLKRPRADGICECFRETLPDEFGGVARPKKVHDSPDGILKLTGCRRTLGGLAGAG